MELKELYKQIAAVEVEVDAIPKSFMSERYHRSIMLHPKDEMTIILKCPNGTCTERMMTISDYELRIAIDNALQSDGTFEITKRCEGWEDEKRKRAGMYHCNSEFILKGRVLMVQKSCEAG